jgi:hypothetical protein
MIIWCKQASKLLWPADWLFDIDYAVLSVHASSCGNGSACRTTHQAATQNKMK